MPLPKARVPLATGRAAKPIAAWSEFCRTAPEECSIALHEPVRLALDAAAWAAIIAVNRTVNATIVAVSDQEHWGVVDRWNYPDDGMGDCEDMQLLKRRMLAEAGLPRRAMRMAVVIDEIGEGHAVLVVRTDRGDLVLDNKTDLVMPWQMTGYAMVKMESADGPSWVALGMPDAPYGAVATAAP